jgi:UDP-N-acetyl-D-glucosamine dehydrogenase
MVKNELARKLAANEAVAGVVGLGYVGIPLAMRFSMVGFPVLDFDIDTDRVDALNAGKNPIKHISGEAIGIPIDPFYLTWKAREHGLSTHFIELAGEINRDMPQWVVTKITDALNDRKKSLKGSRILALGIPYKRNVDGMRESSSVLVMEILRDRGAVVEYSDPNVPVFPKMREHKFDLKSVDLTPETLASYDAVVLMTDHSDFDYKLILQHAKLVVDTRGKYSKPTGNVEKA